MKLLDVNLLVYATNAAAPGHARAWFEETMSGAETVALLWHPLVGATLCSADEDFGRFPGLTWFDPLRS